jgi:hypothetical protein
MAVLKLDIASRRPYANGQGFGAVGPYEQIRGTVTFAVDPEHPANRSVVDLDLAPRDADGRVRFLSDFNLVLPADPQRGSRRLLVELPNRGRKLTGRLNRAPVEAAQSAEGHPGDGWLHRNGWSVASIGWQWDVIRSDRLLGMVAPRAFKDGLPVSGQNIVEIRPSVRERTALLANREHEPYKVAHLDDPDAVLYVREWEDGPDSVVPRSQWRFARETLDGRVIPSREHVYLESGFEPGRYYNLVYTAADAVVVGAGLLAFRDIAAFLKAEDAMNPLAGFIARAYGLGISQTGRMLRHFLYLGLNVDESGRQVYDGLLPHVAGGRLGEFNHRFAQPSVQATAGFGQRFPFADDEWSDPRTGRTDSLLRRQREAGGVPKLIYTNTGAEYWRGDGSLVHTDPMALVDLPQSPQTRIYHFASTQHSIGSLPQRQVNADDGSRGRYPFGVVDYAPLLRAALANLDHWVSAGIEPPPSRHPRIDDGTAVPRATVIEAFKAFPDQAVPDPDKLWVMRTVDLGPDSERGVGRYPAKEGEAYPCLASAVDADGNEVAGIRLPDVTVPVATHTGWNLRHPGSGSPDHQIPMQGFSRFFAATRAQRLAANDPRPSIEERYASRDQYLALVRKAAEALAAERYVLAEDIDVLVANAAARWDAALAAGAAPAIAS